MSVKTFLLRQTWAIYPFLLLPRLIFKSLNSVRGRQNVLTQDIKVFNNISSQSVAPPTFSPSNNLNHPNVDRPCPLGLVSPTPTFNSNDSPDSYNKSPGSSYSSQSPSTSYGLQSKSDNQGVSGRESVCRDGALVTGSASLESVVANPDNSGFIDNSQMLVFQGNGPSFSDGIHTDNPMDLKLAPRQDCAQMFGDNNVYNLQGIKTEPTNQITWGYISNSHSFNYSLSETLLSSKGTSRLWFSQELLCRWLTRVFNPKFATRHFVFGYDKNGSGCQEQSIYRKWFWCPCQRRQHEDSWTGQSASKEAFSGPCANL